MNTRLLAEMIQLAVKKAVREELKEFKKTILTEIRSATSTASRINIDSKKISDRQIPKQHKLKFQNPLLNEMLNVKPLSRSEIESQEMDGSYLDVFKREEAIINIPTTEGGQPIRSIPSKVMEAMNRDYSHLVKKESTNKSNLKNSIISRIESDSHIQDQEGDDEDFSFLDGVS